MKWTTKIEQLYKDGVLISNTIQYKPGEEKIPLNDLCTCGAPHVLMVVHRKDAPCFIYGTNAWVWLTQEEIIAALERANLPTIFSYRMAAQAGATAAKEKNGG